MSLFVVSVFVVLPFLVSVSHTIAAHLVPRCTVCSPPLLLPLFPGPVTLFGSNKSQIMHDSGYFG